MPGLWSRFMLIFKSKASKALDRAEDPSETLDYCYERQLEQLPKVQPRRRRRADSAKRLELQYTSMQQQVDKLDGQAREARRRRTARTSPARR